MWPLLLRNLTIYNNLFCRVPSLHVSFDFSSSYNPSLISRILSRNKIKKPGNSFAKHEDLRLKANRWPLEDAATLQNDDLPV